jgi:DNA-binding XRE family transcriptional regulator
MNKQEFKQQLQKNGLKASHLAQNIGVSPATITNWNKNNKYPKYILYYFECLELRRQVVSIMLNPDFIKKIKY